MTLTPAQNGFIKGVGLAVLSAVVAYVSDPSHLTFLSSGIALVVAGIASSFESHIKDQTGRGLMGAVKINSAIPTSF